MNITRLTTLLIGVTLFTAASVSQTIAGDCYWPSAYSTYSTESVPYFAMHPPVYYSYRVPRTYGYSPYAFPLGALSTDSPRESERVSNRYAGDDYEDRQPTPPLRIKNPFVEQRDDNPTAKVNSPKRQPKVVYPASLAYRAK